MHLKVFVCSHNSHHSTSSNPFSLLLRHRIRRPDGPRWHWPCDRQINIFQIMPPPPPPPKITSFQILLSYFHPLCDLWIFHKWGPFPRFWKRTVIAMFEEMDLLILLLIVQTSTKQYIVLETWRLVLVKSNSNLNVTKRVSIHIMTKFPGSAFNWRQLGVGRLLNAVMSLDKSHNWGYCASVSITSSKCYCN